MKDLVTLQLLDEILRQAQEAAAKGNTEATLDTLGRVRDIIAAHCRRMAKVMELKDLALKAVAEDN